jgi:DNA-binding IclR family transcriptional regulator
MATTSEFGPTQAKPAKDFAQVQVLVRAFSILEAMADRPAGISLADLSRRVGLHKSTTFRMLRTLATLGYVVQSESNRSYRVSDRLRGAVARR